MSTMMSPLGLGCCILEYRLGVSHCLINHAKSPAYCFGFTKITSLMACLELLITLHNLLLHMDKIKI